MESKDLYLIENLFRNALYKNTSDPYMIVKMNLEQIEFEENNEKYINTKTSLTINGKVAVFYNFRNFINAEILKEENKDKFVDKIFKIYQDFMYELAADKLLENMEKYKI